MDMSISTQLMLIWATCQRMTSVCQHSLVYIEAWDTFLPYSSLYCTDYHITGKHLSCQHDYCSDLWGLHGCGEQVWKGLHPAKNTQCQDCRCSASLRQSSIRQPSYFQIQPTHSVGGTGRSEEHVLAVCTEKGRGTWQHEAAHLGITHTKWWRGRNGVLNNTISNGSSQSHHILPKELLPSPTVCFSFNNWWKCLVTVSQQIKLSTLIDPTFSQSHISSFLADPLMSNIAFISLKMVLIF